MEGFLAEKKRMGLAEIPYSMEYYAIMQRDKIFCYKESPFKWMRKKEKRKKKDDKKWPERVEREDNTIDLRYLVDVVNEDPNSPEICLGMSKTIPIKVEKDEKAEWEYVRNTINPLASYPGIENATNVEYIQLRCSSLTEKNMWLNCLEVFDKVNYKPKAILKGNEETWAEYNFSDDFKRMVDISGPLDIPRVLEKALQLCLNHLSTYGGDVRFLFNDEAEPLFEARKLLWRLILEGDSIPSNVDIRTIADTFKNILRRIPQTIISTALLCELVASLKSEAKEYKKFYALTELLPEPHNSIMKSISAFSENMVQREEKSGVDIMALSFCLAPTFLLWEFHEIIKDRNEELPALFEGIINVFNYRYFSKLLDDEIREEIKLAITPDVQEEQEEEKIEITTNKVIELSDEVKEKVKKIESQVGRGNSLFSKIEKDNNEILKFEEETPMIFGSISMAQGRKIKTQTLKEASGLEYTDAPSYPKAKFKSPLFKGPALLGLSIVKAFDEKKKEPPLPNFEKFENSIYHLPFVLPMTSMDEIPKHFLSDLNGEIDISPEMQAGGGGSNVGNNKKKEFQYIRSSALTSPLLSGPALVAIQLGARFGPISKQHKIVDVLNVNCVDPKRKIGKKYDSDDDDDEMKVYTGPDLRMQMAYLKWEVVKNLRNKIKEEEKKIAILRNKVAIERYRAEMEDIELDPSYKPPKPKKKIQISEKEIQTEPALVDGVLLESNPNAMQYNEIQEEEDYEEKHEDGQLLGGRDSKDSNSSDYSSDGSDESINDSESWEEGQNFYDAEEEENESNNSEETSDSNDSSDGSEINLKHKGSNDNKPIPKKNARKRTTSGLSFTGGNANSEGDEFKKYNGVKTVQDMDRKYEAEKQKQIIEKEKRKGEQLQQLHHKSQSRSINSKLMEKSFTESISRSEKSKGSISNSSKRNTNQNKQKGESEKVIASKSMVDMVEMRKLKIVELINELNSQNMNQEEIDEQISRETKRLLDEKDRIRLQKKKHLNNNVTEANKTNGIQNDEKEEDNSKVFEDPLGVNTINNKSESKEIDEDEEEVSSESESMTHNINSMARFKTLYGSGELQRRETLDKKTEEVTSQAVKKNTPLIENYIALKHKEIREENIRILKERRAAAERKRRLEAERRKIEKEKKRKERAKIKRRQKRARFRIENQRVKTELHPKRKQFQKTVSYFTSRLSVLEGLKWQLRKVLHQLDKLMIGKMESP